MTNFGPRAAGGRTGGGAAMRRTMKLCCVWSFVLLAAAVTGQVDPAAQEALAHVFDRPAGTTVQQAHKDKLAAWLQQHEGKDLGAFGYAVALKHYLDRDYPKAVEALDAFCTKQFAIANAEHRTMCGRIFLNAAATEGRAEVPDMAKLTRWGEGMVRFYDDASMLERMAKTIANRAPDAAAFRVALARGVFQSSLTTAQKDTFLRGLYAGDAKVTDGKGTEGHPEAGKAVPALPLRALPPGPAIDQSKVVQPGQAVALAFARVVNGAAGFDLAGCKGKVVVLDFFASWCGPCREAVPQLVALQKEHPADVQVIGVTRYYGNGMASRARTRPCRTGASR